MISLLEILKELGGITGNGIPQNDQEAAPYEDPELDSLRDLLMKNEAHKSDVDVGKSIKK